MGAAHVAASVRRAVKKASRVGRRDTDSMVGETVVHLGGGGVGEVQRGREWDAIF